MKKSNIIISVLSIFVFLACTCLLGAASANKLDEKKVKLTLAKFNAIYCKNNDSCSNPIVTSVGPIFVKNKEAKVRYSTTYTIKETKSDGWEPKKGLINQRKVDSKRTDESTAVFEQDQNGKWFLMGVIRPLGNTEVKEITIKVE